MRAYLIMISLALWLAPACAPQFEHVSTEVSEVCVRNVPLLFDGARNGAATSSFELGDTDLNMDALAGGTITLDSIVLTAGPEVRDFAFADSIDIHLTDSSAASVPLVDMQSVAPARSVSAGGDPDTDLSEHLLAPDTGVEIVISGAVPDTSWTAIIDICLAVDGLDGVDVGGGI